MGWNRYWSSPVETPQVHPDSLNETVKEIKIDKLQSEVTLVENINLVVTSSHNAIKARASLPPPARDKKARRLYSREEPTYQDLEEALGQREVIDESELPFIPPDEVAKHNSRETGIWIVVENRVYDCTDFLDKFHPGSPETILAFAGKQCTWQFWKFHNKRHLKMWSSSLLIGWTDPPPNPFPEPPRWIRTH